MKNPTNRNLTKIPHSRDEVSDCDVSKASKEIMLNRICNGDNLEFPFCTPEKFK